MFSDYIVYVDESGDHGLYQIDPNYPVFVLVFCIFRKQDYIDQLVPALQKLKFDYLGHDQVILYERDIRKRQGPFSLLKDCSVRQTFMEEVAALVRQVPMTLIVSLIDKQKLKTRYVRPGNPYDLSMQFALERLYHFLPSDQASFPTHVVVECRGKVEDRQLEDTFRRVCSGENWHRTPLPFELIFADKKSNSAGLQLADLIARPAGMAYLKPDQPNQAWEIVRTKLYRKNGRTEGYGFKVFP